MGTSRSRHSNSISFVSTSHSSFAAELSWMPSICLISLNQIFFTSTINAAAVACIETTWRFIISNLIPNSHPSRSWFIPLCNSGASFSKKSPDPVDISLELLGANRTAPTKWQPPFFCQPPQTEQVSFPDLLLLTPLSSTKTFLEQYWKPPSF